MSIEPVNKIAPSSPPASSGGERSGAEGQFRRGYATGAHVPLLSRDSAAGGSPAEGERWMSAEVTQPNAPSFAEATGKLQHPAASLTGNEGDRRASLDYLVSTIKAAKASIAEHAAVAKAVAGPDNSPALRHAVAAYGEF